MPHRLTILALMTCLAASARAQIPLSMSHSGYLLDGADAPVTSTNVSMTFRIFDKSAPVGGEVKVFEATCGANVQRGYYNVLLGSAACGESLDSSHVPIDAERYLEVSVGGVSLLPRMLIGSVPTAAVASRSLDAQALTAAMKASGSINTGTNPVDWTQLKNVPADFADGTDDGNTYAAASGGGLALTNGAFGIAAGGVTNAQLASDAASLGKLSGGVLLLALGDLTSTGSITVTGAGKTFAGDGSGLTNLSASAISSGTAAISVSGSAAGFTGNLAGDVTGAQGSTTVGSVGGVTAANVASGAGAANAATSANTVSTIVKRDASGNFSAGAITASQVTGLAAPLGTGDAANKAYVDAAAGSAGKVLKVQEFTASGTWVRPAGVDAVEVFLVAGGGGGGEATSTVCGYWVPGGGGGGGTVLHRVVSVTGSVAVTIGAGGAAGTVNANSANGGDSTFGAILTAKGGGGGGSILRNDHAGKNGGTGGGASPSCMSAGAGGGGGGAGGPASPLLIFSTTTLGQSGGMGSQGGAGGFSSYGSNNRGGDGGIGVDGFGGGGGGGSVNGAGGRGASGGGSGGHNGSNAGTNGLPNTGGGGGGPYFDTASGGGAGSGGAGYARVTWWQ